MISEIIIIKESIDFGRGEGYNMIAVSGCESAPLKHPIYKESNSSTEHEQSHEINIQSAPFTLEHMQNIIQNGSDEQFERDQIPSNTVIALYHQHKLFSCKLLHQRLMKCFNHRQKTMENDNSDDRSELTFIISLMAEITRTHVLLRLPFTIKIALAFYPLTKISSQREGWTAKQQRFLRCCLRTDQSRQKQLGGQKCRGADKLFFVRFLGSFHVFFCLVQQNFCLASLLRRFAFCE